MTTFSVEFPRNFWRTITCNWFLRIFRKIQQNWFLKIRDYLGIRVLWLSFEKFLRNSPELFSKKFMRITLEYFFGNSWEFSGLVHQINRFSGEINKRINWRSSGEFLQNFFPRNSWKSLRNIFRKFLRNLQDLVTKLIDFYRKWMRKLVSRNSWKFPRNTSPEIPEKLSGLGHQLKGFLGN